MGQTSEGKQGIYHQGLNQYSVDQILNIFIMQSDNVLFALVSCQHVLGFVLFLHIYTVQYMLYIKVEFSTNCKI